MKITSLFIMIAKIGFQEVFLDFLIKKGERYLVYSIYDRSAINVRSFAAAATHEVVRINDKRYSAKRKNDGVQYGANRYIERFNSGRDRVTSAMVVSNAVNDIYIITNKEKMERDIYSFLMKKFSLPLLKEWVPYILREGEKYRLISFEDNCIVSEWSERKVDLGGGEIPLNDILVLEISFSEDFLKEIISKGLQSREIKITDEEVLPLSFENLDDYYMKYGTNIVSNLEKLIHPLVEEDGFCCDYTATRSKRLFPAQGNCINGAVARLEIADYVIVNEDMGTGKTVQGLAICDAYHNRKYLKKHKDKTLRDIFEQKLVNYKVAVLCPSHLVNKWVEEGNEIANLNCVAVRNFEQLVKINENREFYLKGKHLFVFSKEFAKLGDTQAPIPTKVGFGYKKTSYCNTCRTNSGRVVRRMFNMKNCPDCGGSDWHKEIDYSSKEYGMICPYCGELLLKKISNLDNVEPLTTRDFESQNSCNKSCYHCGNKLWGSQCKNIGGLAKINWYKVPKRKAGTEWRLNKKGDELVESKTKSFGARKYSPARYIAKQMKNFFDFFIADEAHLYETTSAQAMAFETFIKNSKKTVALTGTLTNGKAVGLFYMFWKLDPEKMKKNGYEFRGDLGETRWNSMYGVMEKRRKVVEDKYNSSSRGYTSSRSILRPGVSPQIMKDFLLESVIQLQISDLSEGLPELNELIVSVPIERDVKHEVNRITEQLQDYAKSKECPAMSVYALQYNLFYSDKPYGMHPIYSPIGNEIVISPHNFDDKVAGGKLLNKEKKLVEIVEAELKEGRNCYVYIEKSGRKIDFFLLTRIKEVLEKNVAKAKVLTIESDTVTASKREKWFRKKVEDEGYNVIISNPRLVETGMDFVWRNFGQLYNFPTLIFYQCGYRLDTLWQASRRSYRLIQPEECRTYFIVSENTMQLEVLSLMAEKQVSVSAIQGGEFSSRGLSAMAKGIDPKIELAKRLKNGEVSDVEEIQKMFKAISMTGVARFENSRENLLIEDITDKRCYFKRDKVSVQTFETMFDFNDDIHAEVREIEKKKQKRNNPELLNFFAEWEEFFEEKSDKKGIKNQVSFFDIFNN